MANGKFSHPRPDREEEREIEKAFRQVTGQDAPPAPPVPGPEELDLNSFDMIFDQEALEEELAQPVVPETPKRFGDTAMDMLNNFLDLCNQNRKVVLVGLCAAALVLILGFMSIFFLSTSDPYDKTILSNVLIANVNVGGMTKDEAISAVKQATSHTYSSLDMIVDLAGTELRLTPKDTGVSLDVKAAVNAAYDYGRKGTAAEKEQAYQNSLTGTHIIGLLPYLELNEDYIKTVLSDFGQNTGSTLTQASYGLEGDIPDLKDEKFDPSTQPQTLVILMGTPGIRFDTEEVYEQILDAYSLHDFLVTVEGLDTVSEPDPVDLQAIYDEFYVEPVNATVDLRTFEVIPGTYGYGFDLDAAEALVEKAQYGEEVRIPMEFLEPTILDGDMFFQDTLAEYETTYRDRGSLQTNLMLACQAIDGTIVNPGESFSFNDTVGKRTADKGYKYADDQIGTEKNRILGGGISQVSSALYYCALVADMNVTNRTSHSLIPGYSDYGLDAAVGWSSPDFKFTNALGLPVQIKASAEGGKVKIAILGTDERDYFVALDYEISGTRPFKTEYEDYKADNKEGYKDGDVIQEGVNGYVVKTYRLKYDDHTGTLLSRDFVVTTQYQSLSKIIVRIEPEETTEATEEPTEPEPTKPKPTETTPAPTDPQVTVPKETEPKVTEPEVTTPKETEPKVTEPMVTEPKVTEPKVTEAASSSETQA